MRVSNKEIVRRMQALCGMNRDDARLAYRCFLRVINDALLQGEKVVLHELGAFDIRHCGRWSRKVVKFKPAQNFAAKFHEHQR